MYDFCPHYREQQQYDPKENHHPTEKQRHAAVIFPCQYLAPESRQRDYRSGEYSREQNHEMVERESPVPCIFRLEQAYLVHYEILYHGKLAVDYQ